MIEPLFVENPSLDCASTAGCAEARESERLSAIFRQRAERLAARKPASIAQATKPVFVFELTPEQYGVELKDVLQVMALANCTPVPGSPPSLLGVINLRGEIRSVIDLRQILQLPPAEEATPGYLIVLRHHEQVVGARVDRVERVRHVEMGELLHASAESEHAGAHFVVGVTSDKLIVLSAAAIFSHSLFKTNSTLEN